MGCPSRISDRLRAWTTTSSRAWRRAQDALVAFQMALALVLLIAAGLLGRSFWNLSHASIGFEPDNENVAVAVPPIAAKSPVTERL